MTTQPPSRPMRTWHAIVAAVVGVAATVFGLTAPSSPAAAVAGTPGSPGTPTVIWAEDFEYNGSVTVDPPKTVTSYVGADGMTYSASPFWSSATACNGIVVSQYSAPATANPTLCFSSNATWNRLRALSAKLSNQFGAAGDLFTVASYTAGSGVEPDDYVQLETNSAVALPPGGAFLTMSIDTGANNCNIGAPMYFMYLTDASGVRSQVVSSGINPCTDPDRIIDTSIDGVSAALVRTVGDAPALIDSSSVVLTVENHNVNGLGNDATFDNLTLIDVSPQLDKEFETPVPFGSTSTITFTITNTYSPSGDGSLTQLDPKQGWHFTDQLPAGLQIVGSPTTGAGAEACANLDSSGTNAGTVSVTADLSSGQAYCTILVEVAAVAPGDYTNLASDVTLAGLGGPLDASVTFTSSPSISLAKTSRLNDVNGDGTTDAGDTITYSFVATNTGNVPLTNAAVTDPAVGAVTCSPTTIPVGGSVTCTATDPHTITLDDMNAGKVDNTATVTGTDYFDPAVTVNDSDTVSTTLNAAPRLSLVKQAATPVDVNASGLTDAGDTIAYSFTITNSGNVSMNSFRVSDPLVGAVTCPSVTLDPGQSTTCTADNLYVVQVGDEAAGLVTNTATAYGTTPGGVEAPSNTADTSTPIATPNPSLSIVKTADTPTDVNSSGLVDTGDTIQYRFTVTNDGNVPLSAVSVNDALAGAVTCAATSLAVGASTTCVADSVYTIAAADESAGTVVNTATATGRDPDNTAITSPPAETVTAVLTPKPSLSILKTADAPVDVNSSGLVDAGDTIQYRFTVTNDGNVPLATVSVSDALAGAVTCAATSLAVGASTTCAADAVYVITTADESAGLVENLASATGRDPDNGVVTSTDDQVTTAIATPEPSLVIDKTADTPVDVNASGLVDSGDTIQYRFTVTNNGNVPISNVVVNDALAGVVTCSATSLTPGQSTTCAADSVYEITAADETTGLVTNTASATGQDPDNLTITSNTATESTPVATPAPSLLIDKTADAPTDVNSSGLTDAGDTIQYRFTVTNNGNVPLTNVAVADPLIGTATCLADSLAVGASTTCTADELYVVTEADETAGVVANTAAATGSDPDGGPVVSKPDTTATAVMLPAPSLRLDKIADTPTDVNNSGLVDVGDTIQYRFTVTNDGNVPLTIVIVRDPRVGNVTCQVSTLAPGESTLCQAESLYTISADDEAAGAVINAAYVTANDPDGDPVQSLPDRTVTLVATPNPTLSIVKTADTPTDVNSSGLVDAGDTIQYRFSVTNTGNVPIGDIDVNDPLVGAVTCEATALAVDASTTCTADAVYSITADDEAAGVAVNTATATGTDPDNNAVTSEPDSTVTAVATPKPSLVLDKIADTPTDVNSSGITDAGDTIQYRFTVTNNGNVPISGIVINDPIVGNVSCSATSLIVGASTACTADALYTVTGTDESNGVIVNNATATGSDPDNGAVNSNVDTTANAVVQPKPQLSFEKIAAAPLDVNGSGITDAGDTIRFSFKVTNTGNVPVADISVVDDIAGPVTCAAAVLAPGDATNCVADNDYVVTDAEEAAGIVVNTASASGTDPDGGAVDSNDDSTTTVATPPAPALTIEKSADTPVDVNNSGLTDAGDTIQYRFTVTNTGNVPLIGLVVTDELAGPVTCDSTTLGVAETTACMADAVYAVTIDDEAAGVVVNTATASGFDPNGGTATSAPDDTTTPVTAPRASLLIVKMADTPVDANSSGITDAGDTIQYRFTVTNNGNIPITQVAVNDELVGSVTCDTTTLAVGATTSCAADAVYTVTETDETNGQIVNTATATGLDPDNNAVESAPDDTTTDVVVPRPALLFVKLADAPVDVNGSGLTDAGDTIQYRFTVSNVGNVPLTGIDVTDPKAGSVACEATSLAVGAATACVADAPYVITEDDEQARQAVNTASAKAADPDGGLVMSNSATATTPVETPDPSLVIDKSADAAIDVNGSGITDAGDTIQYRFTVTNTGNVPIVDVVVNDELVAGVTCTATSLGVDEATDCVADAVYVVTEADEAKGIVVNLAAAAGTDPDGGAVASNTDSTATPVIKPRPLLLFSKSADKAVDVNGSGVTDVGDTIQYRFTVTNVGNVPITDLVVNDELVGGVTCEATALAVDGTTDCVADSVYRITDTDQQAGSVVNTAFVSGEDPDGAGVTSAPDDTTTPVVTPRPSLVVDKIADAPVDVNGSGISDAGDTIQYRFTVTNNGNVPISNIAINDPLVKVVSCEATTLAVNETTNCVASTPYVVTEADEAAGQVRNTATVSGDDPDGQPVESSPDTTSTPVVRPRPSLVIVKRADKPVDANTSGLVDVGDTIQYRFTVTNTGNVPISKLVISDPLAGPVTCATTALTVGKSTKCVADRAYAITAKDSDAGLVVNSASAKGVDPDSGSVSSNTDRTATPVASARPSLVIDKTADTPNDVNNSGLVDAGDTVQYSFTVTNDGNVPVDNIVVNDPLVGVVVCDATRLVPGATAKCQAKDEYVITDDDVAAGLVVNTASATGTDPDGNEVTSNQDSVTVRIDEAFPHLTMVKRALDENGDVATGSYRPGDRVDYRFKVTNDGNVRITNLKISDPMIGSVTCPTTTLEPGESIECRGDAPYIVTAADVAAGEVRNTAEAIAAAPSGAETVTLTAPGEVTVRVVDPDARLPKSGGSVGATVAIALTSAGAGIALWLLTRRRPRRILPRP